MLWLLIWSYPYISITSFLVSQRFVKWYECWNCGQNAAKIGFVHVWLNTERTTGHESCVHSWIVPQQNFWFLIVIWCPTQSATSAIGLFRIETCASTGLYYPQLSPTIPKAYQEFPIHKIRAKPAAETLQYIHMQMYMAKMAKRQALWRCHVLCLGLNGHPTQAIGLNRMHLFSGQVVVSVEHPSTAPLNFMNNSLQRCLDCYAQFFSNETPANREWFEIQPFKVQVFQTILCKLFPYPLWYTQLMNYP